MARMTRRRFIKNAGVAGATAAAIASPAIAQSSPTIRWRLTASWPKSLDALYGSAEHFARYVAEATDNKFVMQTFAAGEIVPALQATDAVSSGTVEACHTAPYYSGARTPRSRSPAPCRSGSTAACRTRGGAMAAASSW